MIYFLFTIATLSLATCVYLYRQWGRTIEALRRSNRAREKHADELTRVEVDSFAAGYEACAELMPEVVAVRACGCARCRAEKWAVN